MIEHLRRGPEAGDGIGDALAGDVERRAMDRFEHRREAPLRIDVGRRRDAEAAGQRTGKVGQDVGVEVGGDDGVEALRLQRHPHRHRIDQHLVPGDVGKLFRHLLGDLVPHHHAMALGIGFRHHREQLARARLRQRERIVHDAANTDPGEDRHLGADLLGQSAVHAATAAGIFAFGILAHDHPVEIADADIAQRRRDAGQDLGGPDIGVLVERLADGES